MLEPNDERQPETPSDVSSSSEIPGGSSRNKRKQKIKVLQQLKNQKLQLLQRNNGVQHMIG